MSTGTRREVPLYERENRILSRAPLSRACKRSQWRPIVLLTCRQTCKGHRRPLHPAGWSSGWHCGLGRATAGGTWPGETVRWREDIQGGGPPEDKNRTTFRSWIISRRESKTKWHKRGDASSNTLIRNFVLKKLHCVFHILSYSSLADESFFLPSKDKCKCCTTANVSQTPRLSFALSSLPLASSQGRRSSPETVAQHVALASPGPPTPPPLHHLLRAAVALAWGIRAITAISR